MIHGTTPFLHSVALARMIPEAAASIAIGRRPGALLHSSLTTPAAPA
jgi:hypothetical protein